MADQQPAGNAEPEHHNELDVNIGQFRLRLTGKAATIIATTGTFAIAGYCVYKVLNSEKLTDCIAHAITKGSVEIEIIAESGDAANQALPIFSSTKLLEMFNKSLEEYSAKHNHHIGKFDSVKLIQFLMSNMKANELSKLKKDANDLKEQYEQDLNMTLQRNISELETITTTTTTTKVIKRNVSENFTLSSKNATSSTKQQELVRKECIMVEKSTQTEPVATEASGQTSLATKEEGSKKSSSTQTDPVNIISRGVGKLELNENEERQASLTLEDIFSVKDDVSNTEEGNLDEAHDVIKEQNEPSLFSVAKCLHRYSQALVKAEYFSEIPNLVQTLFNLVQEQIQITANDVKVFAKKLRSEKKFIDAHLCFQIASKFQELDPNPNRVVDGILECVKKMNFTQNELLQSSEYFKSFIIKCGIPVMHDLLRKIQNTGGVEKNYRTLREARCRNYIYSSYSLVEDWKSCESTLKQGISLMRDVFVEDAVKHRVYGCLLNNLGFAYRKLSQPDEALKYYQLAYDASKKAEVCGSEQKKKDTSTAERNIAAVRRQLVGKK